MTDSIILVPALAALALLLEQLIGYPAFLYKNIGHPVEWFGKAITAADTYLNTGDKSPQATRMAGVLSISILCIAVAAPLWILSALLSTFQYGWILNVALATTLIAHTSLRDHVIAVADACTISLPRARLEVAKIVGRDTSAMTESDICRASLESLAENTSDGVIAPALWYAIAGLPGIAIYKLVNTADSMIGHRNEKYLHFGWAAARLDDVLNLPASRLTALIFALAARLGSAESARHSLATAWRDASKHNSPNAGWPEAAMAGALGVKFGGPRNYEGELIDLPWMGDGREHATTKDIWAGLAITDITGVTLAVFFAVLAILL